MVDGKGHTVPIWLRHPALLYPRDPRDVLLLLLHNVAHYRGIENPFLGFCLLPRKAAVRLNSVAAVSWKVNHFTVNITLIIMHIVLNKALILIQIVTHCEHTAKRHCDSRLIDDQLSRPSYLRWGGKILSQTNIQIMKNKT